MIGRDMSRSTLRLIAGVSLAAISLTGCNKQPNAGSHTAAAEAPPIAALPLTAAAVAPAAPAPAVSALPPPQRRISYAPPPPNERYGYIDRAYSMGSAFADTPPDYMIDYQGTRPWIWRAANGAYRVVERLPRGERIYYYDPGQDQPFLVRDPDYSYAYDGGNLVGVYGPDGAEIDGAMAARRSYEASRYLDRSRELYRAAQYQRRQAAYASEWAARRDDLRNQHRIWEEQQARNSNWRAWHDAHQAQEAGQWNQERDQRVAYAAAIGIPAASSGPLPSPDDLARRQAAYFANRRAANTQTPNPKALVQATGPTRTPQNQVATAPPIVKVPAAAQRNPANVQQANVAAAQAKAEQLKASQVAQAQEATASTKQKEAAAAQMKAAQAAKAQQAAADERKKATAMAQASAAKAAQAQKAALEAKQKAAASAQIKAVQAAAAQKAAAQARQKEAAAAQAKAAQAVQAERASADEKQKEAAAAQAKEKQAARAQQVADDARRKEAATAQAKAAKAAQAQKVNAEAKQHEAATAQAATRRSAHEQKSTGKPGAPAGKDKSKGRPEDKKDHQEGQPQ